MKHNQNNRRQRSRGNGRRYPNQRGGAFESSGPEVKVRGTAQQVLEKYQSLARDAFSAGDRILAEGYLQHAEHYYRILNAENEANGRDRDPNRNRFARGNRDEDFDFDGDEDMQDDGVQQQSSNGSGGQPETVEIAIQESASPDDGGDADPDDAGSTEQVAQESETRPRRPRGRRPRKPEQPDVAAADQQPAVGDD